MMLALRCPPRASTIRGLDLIRARLSTSAVRSRRPRTPSPTSRLGHTTVFYQAGLKIRELPLVVQKVNDVLNISGMDTFGDLVISTDSGRGRGSVSVKLPPDEETKEVLAGFNRCFSVHGIFRLLETVPTEEVTPLVAVHVLKKIIDLENDNFSRSTVPSAPKTPLTAQLLRDRGSSTSSKPPVPPPKPAVVLTQTGVTKNDNFLRIAFINMLLDIVYRSKDPDVILDGLRVISRDSFPVDQNAYKERMCEETLLCVSNGMFDLSQICEAVVVLSDFFADKKKSQKVCDKLWSGILDASDQIDAYTISSVFKTLPHLKNSRDIVFKFVSDRVEQFWQEYTIRDMLEILKSLMDVSMSSGKGGGATAGHSKVLKVVSQWLKVNIHTLNEGETLAVIYCLHRLEYLDEVVVQTLERYLKVRGCQIRERDLVATICDYCMDFRVRSKAVLEGAGEYFIAHADQLSTPQLYSIVR